MTDPALVALAAISISCAIPKLDKLYPKDFAGWVAASDRRQVGARRHPEPDRLRRRPIDAHGITEKFRGINPHLPADRIAASHSISSVIRFASCSLLHT